MKRRAFLAGASAGTVALAMPAIVRGQDVTTLRVHQMLPAQATIPSKAIDPWTKRVEEASGGRLKFELYPAMQLGGAPPDLYDQAKVREFDANPVLVGKYLAQVPKHRGSVQVVYTHPKLADIAFAIQSLGMQFDDDLNVRTVPGLAKPGLPGYTVASFSISRPVGRNFEGFFTVQNMFDKEYFVGTLPTTVGSPRIVSGGVRVRFASRARP